MNLPQITLTRSGIEIIVTNPTMNNIVRMAVLADYENANYYLGLILVLLICLCFKQIHAFSRPPPVQRKKLPRRPALQIMFKPDGISSAQTFGLRQKDHDQQYDDYEGENEMEMAQDLHDDKSINPSIPTVVVSDQPHSDETYASPPTQSYTSEPSRSKRLKKTSPHTTFPMALPASSLLPRWKSYTKSSQLTFSTLCRLRHPSASHTGGMKYPSK